MLRNWKFLVKLLRGRPHTIGAEVGVFEGECALGLLTGLPNLNRLICIDLWEFNAEFFRLMPNKRGRILSADWTKVIDKFITTVAEPYSDRIIPMRLPSLTAANLVLDESLDFVFIDANHAYDYVSADIDAWTPKVKQGGIIAGDDYVNKPGYGVVQAVSEQIAVFRVDRHSRVWYTVKGSQG